MCCRPCCCNCNWLRDDLVLIPRDMVQVRGCTRALERELAGGCTRTLEQNLDSRMGCCF